MAFWDKVKGETKKALEDGWTAVKEGAKIAAEKSEEYTKIGKLKFNIRTLHNQAEKHFTELGGLVYDYAKPPYENPLSSTEVKDLVEKIKTLEDEIAELEKEVEHLRTQEETSEAPETGEKEEKEEDTKEK